MCGRIRVNRVICDIRPALNIRLIVDIFRRFRLTSAHPFVAQVGIHCAMLIVEVSENSGNHVDVSMLYTICRWLVSWYSGLYHAGIILRNSRNIHLKCFD